MHSINREERIDRSIVCRSIRRNETKIIQIGESDVLLSDSGVVQPVSEHFFSYHLREGHGNGDEPQQVESHFHRSATDLVDLHLDFVLLILQFVD